MTPRVRPMPPRPAKAAGRGGQLPVLLAYAAFGLAAWLVWFGQPKAQATSAVPPVPTMVGPWHGAPLEITKRIVEILETDDVDLLEYRQGEEPPIWLARVAGFGTRAAFHPPELCYVGSHYEVLEREPIVVSVGGKPHRVMRLVVAQDGERFEAWYWFTAGDRVTPNYYQQQWWLMVDAVRRQPLSGTLVRISTPADDPERSRQRLEGFLGALVQHDA